MATMVPLRDFYKFIQSDVPKAPVDVIGFCLIDVLRDFCLKTYVWTQMSNWVDLLAGQSTYGFDVPENCGICGIVHAEYRQSTGVNPQEVLPISMDELNARRPNWRNETGLAPRHYLLRMPWLLQVIPYPASTDADQLSAFRVEVAMWPSTTAVEAPSFLLENWGSGIGHGVKAQLMAMPKQPWSGDPTYCKAMYMDKVNSCRTQVNKSATRTSSRAKIPGGV